MATPQAAKNTPKNTPDHPQGVSTQAVTATAPGHEKKPVEAINPARMAGAEFKRNQWCVVATPGASVEDISRPEFWAHVAQDMKPWDKLEIRADDASWYAEAIVTDVSRQWARLKVVFYAALTTADVGMSQAEAMNITSEYSVEYRGEHSKWSVIRKSDQACVHEGENTRAGAVAWMAGRVQAG